MKTIKEEEDEYTSEDLDDIPETEQGNEPVQLRIAR